MQLELVLENDEFLDFVRAFRTGAWTEEVKPSFSLNVESDLDNPPSQRSIEQIGGVAFTISIVLPGLKILAGVIKTYLETRKTQLEIRNGNKKIAISGPASSVAKILEQLQELGGSHGE